MTNEHEQNRLAVFHSAGHDLRPVLDALERERPGARITIWIPRDHKLTDDIAARVNAVYETELSHYSPRQFRACWRLIRRLRDERYDAFAVLYNSPQLRMLAALSGAPVCWCATGDRRLTPIPSNPMRVAIGEALLGVGGRLRYVRVWLSVYCFPARR